MTHTDVTREQARQDNGRFGTQMLDEATGVDLFDLRAEAQQKADALRKDADAHASLVHRIEAYSVLKDYPAGYTVRTLVWDDEPNDDGSFDVNLQEVFDADGNEVENFDGNPGGIPAGWFDENGKPHTAFDTWRVPSNDMSHDISIGMMHAWFKDYQAYRADAQPKTELDIARGAISDMFERLRRNEMAGPHSTTQIGDVEVSVVLGNSYTGTHRNPRGTSGRISLRSPHRQNLIVSFNRAPDENSFASFSEANEVAAQALAEWGKADLGRKP